MTWTQALWVAVVNYWPLVFSVFLPFAVARIAACSWSTAAKTWTAVLLSLALGVLGTMVTGLAFTPETLIVFVTSAFTISSVAYAEFKRHKITADWLDRLLNGGAE